MPTSNAIRKFDKRANRLGRSCIRPIVSHMSCNGLSADQEDPKCSLHCHEFLRVLSPRCGICNNAVNLKRMVLFQRLPPVHHNVYCNGVAFHNHRASDRGVVVRIGGHCCHHHQHERAGSFLSASSHPEDNSVIFDNHWFHNDTRWCLPRFLQD